MHSPMHSPLLYVLRHDYPHRRLTEMTTGVWIVPQRDGRASRLKSGRRIGVLLVL